MFSTLFKKARESLGKSQSAIAKEIGITHVSISNFEHGKSEKPNWHYVQYLIKHGINPYFLIGESDEMHGQKIANMIPKETHERILKELESEKKELKTKYEALQETFKLINTHQ